MYRSNRGVKISLIAFCIAGLSLFFTSATHYQVGVEATETPRFSEGFNLLMSSLGAALFQKEYAGGNPDFVQVVDLSEGAKIKLMYGQIQELRTGLGVYGGNDARLVSHTIQHYWDELSGFFKDAFCVTNGQFFYMREYPTRLPFPLKVDGQLLSEGYAKNEFPGQKLILEIWNDRADIVALNEENLLHSTAPDIIAGLTEDARKSPEKFVGRTFIGVSDKNRDGLYETVLIFNTQTARQVDAANILRSFGAIKVMMLDGGSSTQLICRDKPYITTDRLIPQAIGVIARFSPETNQLSGYDKFGALRVVQATVSNVKTITPTLTLKPKRTKTAVTPRPTHVHPGKANKTPSVSPVYTATSSSSGRQPAQGGGLSDLLWVLLAIIVIAPLLFFLIQTRRRS
jgi:hypothetical protein